MLTKDDLQAIAETMNPLIKAEGQLIRKDTRNFIDANNIIMGKIVRIDLAAQKQEIIEVMKVGFKEVGRVIGEVKEEIHSERLKQLEDRVKKLEKQQVHNHS